jgi:hypothetical protein
MEPNNDSSPCKTGERKERGKAPSSGGRPTTANRNARSQKPCLNASALRLAKIRASRCDVRYDSQAAPRSAAPAAMKPAATAKIVPFDNRCLPTCTVPCASAASLTSSERHVQIDL